MRNVKQQIELMTELLEQDIAMSQAFWAQSVHTFQLRKSSYKHLMFLTFKDKLSKSPRHNPYLFFQHNVCSSSFLLTFHNL